MTKSEAAREVSGTRCVQKKRERKREVRTNYSFDGLMEIHETPMGCGHQDPVRDSPHPMTKMRKTEAW